MKRSIFVTTIFFLAQLLLIALLVPYKVINWANELEYSMMDKAYSERSINWMKLKTDSVHYTLTRDTGLADMMEWVFFPSEEAKLKEKGISQLGDNLWFPYLRSRGHALDEMIKLLIMRGISVLMWTPILILVAIPSFYDGLMERRIKQHTFKYPSPFLYRYGAKASFFTLWFLLFVFFSPIPLPPFLIPITIIISTVVAGLIVVGNLPKRL